MELSQPRPFGAAQGRKVTHDFLSLYSHSSVQQEPKPSHGGFLKTHIFLQPPEVEGKNAPKVDNTVDINLEKPPPAAPPPSAVEHVLHGGIGTYSVSHISYSNPRLPKPEENVFAVASVPGNDRNDDNSNSSSYTGSGFSLWDETEARKRNSGKENVGDINVVKESTLKEVQWPLDQPTESSSNHHSNASPVASSQALTKNYQTFMKMNKSENGPYSIEVHEQNLSLKRESSCLQKGELQVKVDGKSCDQKANTPRSKHSATEQRRRCKINDRFQKLRGLIPNSDQKRDKASFLLEVIDYIQFLQEKVNRYEGSHVGWGAESTNLIPWMQSNHLRPCESLADQPRVVKSVASPIMMFGAKLDENIQIPAEANATNTIDFKLIDQQSQMTYKAASSSSPLHSDVYAPIRNTSSAKGPSIRIPSDTPNGHLAESQLWRNRVSSPEAAAANRLKDQEMALAVGTISVSSIYSQGLLNTLTRALQSSGVDLSEASISVEVDIGKRANKTQNGHDPIEMKVAEAPSANQAILHARAESPSLDSNHRVKRIKTR